MMNTRLVTDDNFFTCASTWEDVAEYIPKDKVIWEAFYNEHSESAIHLQNIGCEQVINDGNLDFYTDFPIQAELIVSNPPFTNKEQLMKRLYELDLPFMLIFPIHSLRIRCVKKYFGNKLQIILPKKRIHFAQFNGEDNQLIAKKQPSFDCIYICYEMNLPSDLVWL